MLQFVAVPALRPLNVTVLLPWDAPKLLPVIVTLLPAAPELEDRLVTAGIEIVYVAEVTVLFARPLA